MELRQAIRSRRSVRAFHPDPIPVDALEDLLELANWAPSAGNLQSRAFVLVREESARRGLARAALDQEFLAQAPVVLVVCADLARVATRYGKRGRELYALQDAAAAAQNFLLAAYEMGLGTCWVGAFDEEAARRILHLPREVRPVALVPVGRPAETPEPPERLRRDRLVHWDGW